MSCPYCGKNIPVGSAFCGYCGKDISHDHAPLPTYTPRTVIASTATALPPITGRPVGQRNQQARPAAGSPSNRATRPTLLYGLLTLIVLVVLGGFILLTRDTGTVSSTSTSQSAGSTPNPVLGIGTPVPNEGNAHVAPGTMIIYRTYPPSSGPHYPSTAPYGFSDVEIPEGYFVHSMEHGAVVLYYRPDVSDAVKQQLKDLFNKLPPSKYGSVKLIVTPYTTGMTTPLAIAAWDRLLLMKEYNFNEILTFYQTWVDKGPESLP